MNCLDIEVSCFANYNTPENPVPININTWLHSKKYAHLVERIRATDDKKERDKLKAQLPAITPSGLFSRREQIALIKHSGLIQFDIDGHDNSHIANFSALKHQIARLEEVAYCGDSVSGRGFWGLVPIAHPDKHKLHFQALKQDFEKWGIVLDDKPKNVASLRGYSYDAEAYFNPTAKVYTKLFKRQSQQYRNTYQGNITGNEAEKMEACLTQIEAGRIDITGSYSEWFDIGCSLANEFGEAGREYFHRASQFHPSYDSSKTDKQYTHCLGRNYSYKIGTFFYYAELHRITYKEAIQQPQNEIEPPTAQAEPIQAKETTNEPAPQPVGQEPAAQEEQQQEETLPPGWKYKTLGNDWNVLLDGDGLPATWNLCPKNELEKEAIEQEEERTGIKANPVASQLIKTFGLVIERIEHWEPEAEPVAHL